jgi:hypothetical protein
MTKMVVISQHAVTRVLQRFRVFMYAEEIARLELFLRRQFSKALRDIRVDMVPFYNHILREKYGEGAFYAHSPMLTFMCNELSDRIIVKSVLKRQDDWDKRVFQP